MVKGHSSTRSVSIAGFDKAGPWALLARGLCLDAVHKTAIDLNRFRFESVDDVNDEMMLPGALRYGGMPSFARLTVGYSLLAFNAEGTGCEQLGKIAANDLVRVEAGALSQEAAIEWLLK